MTDIELDDDPELERPLHRLMELTGEDQDTAIGNAVREALEKLDKEANPSALKK